jgi:hypothetical protein
VLGVALNEVFVPLLQKQFPEIADFYLPPEGCSYRIAVVSLKKQYAGHAKRVMFGVWSFLRQFMSKIVVVTDADDIRDWKDVIWAITTRVDPARDTLLVESTPIDYLDFASPVSGLGSKMGIDATNKWPGETTRAWGRPISMDPAVKARIDAVGRLGIWRLNPAPSSVRPQHGERIRDSRPAPHATPHRRRARSVSRPPASNARRARRRWPARRRLDVTHREHDARAVKLGARDELRLPFRDVDVALAHLSSQACQ